MILFERKNLQKYFSFPIKIKGIFCKKKKKVLNLFDKFSVKKKWHKMLIKKKLLSTVAKKFLNRHEKVGADKWL